MTTLPTIAPAPAVLPYPREDGYWLVEKGRAIWRPFVPSPERRVLILPRAPVRRCAAGAPAGPSDGLAACTAGAKLDAELSLDNWYFGPESQA